ncbi:MAG: uL22 family ribosomal protein [Nanoarchaeota archaeon]
METNNKTDAKFKNMEKQQAESKMIESHNNHKDKLNIVKNNEEKVSEKSEEHNKNKQQKKEAVVNAKDVGISTKHSIAICNYIKGKTLDTAFSMLSAVERMKKAVPMKGEIPHRRGMMSGRYPINATIEFIKLLKSLKSNAIANELEFEKYVIFCKADVAPRPYKRFGKGRFKRTHITLKLVEPIKKQGDKK